jgi:hypothetical protein
VYSDVVSINDLLKLLGWWLDGTIKKVRNYSNRSRRNHRR